jgi:hypothetical protein
MTNKIVTTILPQQLRKGNCVCLENELCYVSQILWDRVEVVFIKDNEKTYRECKYEDLQGIALTPDILLACGFVKKDRFHFSDVFTSKNEDFIINQLRDSCEISFGIKGSFAIVSNRIHPLHELQNLYYALTGEEITIHSLPLAAS